MSTDEKKPDTLNKPLNLNQVTTPEGLTQFGASPSIHSRIAAAAKKRELQAQAQAQLGGSKFINFGRLFILPDISGSMDGNVDGHKTKLDLLKVAVDTYLKNCNPSANLVGVASFPEGAFASPSGDYVALRASVQALEPSGSTPMGEALGYIMENEQFTHAVIISDGGADNPTEVLELAKEYKTRKITCDCVHIGSDVSGEELLKSVAEITGGAYIKFTDVTSFAKSFQYLSPAKRAFLNAHKNPVALLGAAEVKL